MIILLISLSILSNWRQFSSKKTSSSPLFQFDGGENSAEKFQQMNVNGYLFVNLSTINTKQIKCHSTKKFFTANNFDKINKSPSTRGNFVLKMAHELFEILCQNFPMAKTFVLTKLFPYYSAYLAI